MSVFAIDDARAPGGPATCGRKGKGYVGQYMESDSRRCPRCRPVLVRTEATPGEAIE